MNSRDEFSVLKDNPFWYFLFSQHTDDAHRARLFKKIISVLRNAHRMQINEFLKAYEKLYRSELSLTILNELFCLNAKDICGIFSECGQIFSVNGSIIQFNSPSERCINIKDLFNAERIRLEQKATAIALLGDKIAKILRNSCDDRMDILEMMRRINFPPDDNDPKLFIGRLSLYFGPEHFVMERDSAVPCGVSIRIVHYRRWPSDRRKQIERMLQTSCTYPCLVNVQNKDSPRQFDVQIPIDFPQLPSDGFFLNFCAMQERRIYIREQLRLLYEHHNAQSNSTGSLRPATLYPGWLCLLEHEECLHRARITGQTGDGRLMVECVDDCLIVFVEPNRVWEVPPSLVGIPIGGVYGVLSFPNKFVRPMNISEKKEWIDLLKKVSTTLNSSVSANFIGDTSDSEYSGLRKSMVFKVQLTINIDVQSLSLPDIWQ